MTGEKDTRDELIALLRRQVKSLQEENEYSSNADHERWRKEAALEGEIQRLKLQIVGLEDERRKFIEAIIGDVLTRLEAFPGSAIEDVIREKLNNGIRETYGSID